jgi:hypothetical protein
MFCLPSPPTSPETFGAFGFGGFMASPQPDKPMASKSTYAKRAYKPVPSRSGDDQRDRRRNLFLKKVREEREEKRWADRSGDDSEVRGWATRINERRNTDTTP